MMIDPDGVADLLVTAAGDPVHGTKAGRTLVVTCASALDAAREHQSMSDSTPPPPPGTVGWIDLTTRNADKVRDFYGAVVGWTHTGIDMDGYQDWCMQPGPDQPPAVGICHRRGKNAEQPPGWMVYFVVENLDAALAEVEARGGTVLAPPRGDSYRFAIISDPDGSSCALFQNG